MLQPHCSTKSRICTSRSLKAHSVFRPLPKSFFPSSSCCHVHQHHFSSQSWIKRRSQDATLSLGWGTDNWHESPGFGTFNVHKQSPLWKKTTHQLKHSFQLCQIKKKKPRGTLQPQNNFCPTQISGSFVSNSLELLSLDQQLVFPHPMFSQRDDYTQRKLLSSGGELCNPHCKGRGGIWKENLTFQSSCSTFPDFQLQAKQRERKECCQTANNQKRHSLLESPTGLESSKRKKNKTQKQPANPKCLYNPYTWSKMSF